MTDVWIKFAIRLINRQMRKMEQAAAQKIVNSGYRDKTSLTLMNAFDEPVEYMDLRHLKYNLTDLRSPWMGIFNPFRTREPKKGGYDKFEKFEPRPATDMWGNPLDAPLRVTDQSWAELSNAEFFERLSTEPDGNW